MRTGMLALLWLWVPAVAASPARLSVGINDARPPLSYWDANGRPAGFAVDVFNEAARRESITLSWRIIGDSTSNEGALRRGELDFIATGLDTPSRHREFYISEPWWINDLSVLVRAGTRLFTPEDLRGKRLVSTAPALTPALAPVFPGAIFSSSYPAEAAFGALCQDRADALALNLMDLQRVLLARPQACTGVDLRVIRAGIPSELCIVARKPVEALARRLRQRIDELTADGTLVTLALQNPPVPSRSAMLLTHNLREKYNLLVWSITLSSAVVLLGISAWFILRQRRIQTALRNRQELLSGLVEAIPVMIAIYDPRLKEFSVNREFARVLGWTGEDARRLDLMEACYPNPAVRADVAQFMQSAASGWRDFDVTAQDGTVVRSSWSNIRLSDKTLVSIGIDLRERLRADEQLLESYAQFSTLVANIPDLVFRLDPSLRFVYLSPTARRFGIAPDRLVGKTAAEARLAPELRNTIEAECREALRTGAQRQFEVAYENTCARVRLLPERLLSGEIVSVLGVAENVTEARRMEQSLRESEERLSIAFEHAGLGLWDADLIRGTRFWNSRCYEVLGFEPYSIEPDPEIWRSRVHPQDRERFVEADERARREHSHYSCLYRVVRADNGAVVWLEDRGRYEYDVRGEAVRFTGIFLDVTGRKRAEAEIETIIDAVPALTFIARDPECRYISGSRMTYEVLRAPFGCNVSRSAPANDLLKHVRFMKDGRELQLHEMPLRIAIRTGQPLRDCELDVVFEDGSSRHLFGNAVPLLDEAGHTRGAVAAFTDITDLKRMEERLRHTQKMESIGLLAGGIAHDFNNILVGIIGNASLAAESLGADHSAREFLDQVISSGEHAALLTRQMLAYAGKGRFRVELMDLSEVVRQTIALVQPSISKKIAVHLDLASDLSALRADRSQIQQVIMNLVLNAAEAIGDRTGLISVRTDLRTLGQTDGGGAAEEFQVAPGDYLGIEVRDTGCGMDAAVRARIFDPFFTTKFTGRGLGLAAVAGIVRAHKGAISVNTAPGQGSSFLVLFPAAGRALPSPPAAKPEKKEDLDGSGGVLVVDDEPAVRRMAVRALERCGYVVRSAADGPSAIDLFRAEAANINVIVLDLSMPGMSGEEVLPELHKIKSDVAVIVSSGYTEAEALRVFAGANVAGFVQKPYTNRQLARKVKSVLERAAAARTAQ